MPKVGEMAPATLRNWSVVHNSLRGCRDKGGIMAQGQAVSAVDVMHQARTFRVFTQQAFSEIRVYEGF